MQGQGQHGESIVRVSALQWCAADRKRHSPLSLHPCLKRSCSTQDRGAVCGSLLSAHCAVPSTASSTADSSPISSTCPSLKEAVMHCTVGDSATPSSSKRMLPAPAGPLVSNSAGRGRGHRGAHGPWSLQSSCTVPVCWKAVKRVPVQCWDLIWELCQGYIPSWDPLWQGSPSLLKPLDFCRLVYSRQCNGQRGAP